MDTKKFERATEIMNELKRLHESLENLECVNKLTFSDIHRSGEIETFYEKSRIFAICKEAVTREIESRIAQLEKEFNKL